MKFGIGLVCAILISAGACPVAWGLDGCPLRPSADERSQTPRDPVVVQLTDGQCFSGDIAAATDVTGLWLLRERGPIAVLRPLDWNAVGRVSVLGKTFTGDEFRRVVAEMRKWIPPPRTAQVTSIHLVGMAPAPMACRPSQSAGELPRVQCLEIDAATCRWSDTVEEDGLVVHVYPRDDEGGVVPTYGTLEVDLTGRPLAYTALAQPFFNQGRWVQQVRPQDFGPRGAVYRLPFQGVRPEFDVNLAAAGAVHARLSVPGQGTFDATQSTVPTRPFSPVRDQLQVLTGSRFFPQERTTISRPPAPAIGQEAPGGF